MCGSCLSDPTTPECHPLSLHDALPISQGQGNQSSAAQAGMSAPAVTAAASTQTQTAATVSAPAAGGRRSEEHTSELQSRVDLVCRLLLEKNNVHAAQPALVRSASPIHA